MTDLRNCEDCRYPMDYAGCAERPANGAIPPAAATEVTIRFWVRCPKCEKSVVRDAQALRKMLESERLARSEKVGHLERTLRAWGIPYTPSNR